jgi:hypothetical protein
LHADEAATAIEILLARVAVRTGGQVAARVEKDDSRVAAQPVTGEGTDVFGRVYCEGVRIVQLRERGDPGRIALVPIPGGTRKTSVRTGSDG